MNARATRVLIVDDSALVRQTLAEIFARDPEIEVMAMASDPFMAAERLARETPDVITLDVEMPRMDGLTFLRKLMAQHPIPVVMCSTLTEEHSDAALRALEYGAVEIIQKPRIGTRRFLEESAIRICDAVKAAARARVAPRSPRPAHVAPKLTADAVLQGARTPTLETTDKVVAVGASTGGTEALRVLLEAMPPDCPGVVVVQHMPERFTAAFANRLNGLCRIEVREARDGDAVLRGLALIAPGDRHMLLHRSGARYHVEVREGPLVRRHRPSVDVLFRSAARYAGPNAVGIIMTGMGDDGAAGLKEMRDAGARTLAQDEASCVVFGMPGEAVKLGAAERTLPLEALAGAALRCAAGSSTSGSPGGSLGSAPGRTEARA